MFLQGLGAVIVITAWACVFQMPATPQSVHSQDTQIVSPLFETRWILVTFIEITFLLEVAFITLW